MQILTLPVLINGSVAVREGHRLSTGEGGFESRRSRHLFLAYSLLGEGTRLLTENEVGSNPTRSASFGMGTAIHYSLKTMDVLADNTIP